MASSPVAAVVKGNYIFVVMDDGNIWLTNNARAKGTWDQGTPLPGSQAARRESADQVVDELLENK